LTSLTRTLLTAIFLTLFSQTARAEKAVYFCTVKNIVMIDDHNLRVYESPLYKQREPKRFRMVVDAEEKQVSFKGDELNNDRLNISEFWSKDSWEAKGDPDEQEIAKFDVGILYYIDISTGPYVLTADCEDF